MNQLCKKIQVSGKVQGVCFRAFTQKMAQELQLTGWVQNENDGSVLVFACGDEEKLDLFIAQLRQGHPVAHVATVKVDAAEHQVFTDFTIKR
jgi:acylphosphatase